MICFPWVISCMEASGVPTIPALKDFNQAVGKSTDEVTTVGYLPIIPAPAHDLDTVMTFPLRSKAIVTKQGQRTTGITLDQALYHKARELVWLYPEKLNYVIVRLGSFHTAMNYLQVLGRHFPQSGLTDIWIEAGVFSECVAQKIMQGKPWNRAVRAHKLTMEAMWRVLFKSFKIWLESSHKCSLEHVKDAATSIAKTFEAKDQAKCTQAIVDFVTQAPDLMRDLDEFVELNSNNSTFMFWKQH